MEKKKIINTTDRNYVPQTEEEIATYIDQNMWLVRWAIFPMSKKLDATEKEDLLQEGVIGFLQGIANFKPYGKAALQTYCCHCIQNAARHYLRDQTPKGGYGKKTVSYSDVFQPKPNANHDGKDSEDNSYSFTNDTDGCHGMVFSVEEEIDNAVMIENIRDVAKKILPPDIFKEFWMHYNGLTQVQIAEKMGQSQATVSKNLGVARAALQKVIPRDTFAC